MQKPNNYDNTQALGEFTPIELGGHKLVILGVKEDKTKTGIDIIKVQFDTARDDAQPNYYQDAYKNDTRDNKKYGGEINIFPTDNKGNTSKQFKTFCTAVEHSNAGFKVQWGDAFAGCFKGKLVGGVFGEEEYYNNNGELKTARKLFWFRKIDGITDANIPNKRTAEPQQGNPVGSDGFMSIPDGIEEELPFA